jgi:ubiquinone/menaquinone biosynthesis C-methylase UbiE
VTGVDLTPSYVDAAKILADWTSLGERVDYEVGDLLALQFKDKIFDLVWTQHVVMNIADRAGLYREFRRVLKPAGQLAFYDVIAADGHPDLIFPVPWAESPDASILLTEAETKTALQGAGFDLTVWKEVTAEALAWLARPRPPAAPGLNLATVMGPRFPLMGANFGRNLHEGRARLVMGGARTVSA